MNDTQADIFLWNAFKQGDRQAFDQLFRRYYPVLMQYGTKLCQERAILEDGIQELFLEIWQSRSSTEIHSVKAYLLKALKYKLYRQLRNNRTISTIGADEELNFVLSAEHFLIEKEDKRRNAMRVIDAVNALPSRQKEIIYLRIYQGLSYEEISEVMSINYQVARNLFSQSLKSLREALGKIVGK